MQRRSFLRRLFGGVLAGLAAPRVGLAGADPAAPFIYSPMVGGAYAPGEVFNITSRTFEMPLTIAERNYAAGETMMIRLPGLTDTAT